MFARCLRINYLTKHAFLIVLLSHSLVACRVSASQKPPQHYTPLVYKTLTLWATANVAMQAQCYRANVKLTIQKDQAIAFQVTVLGLWTILYGTITPQCVEIINKHTQTHDIYDYPRLRKLLGVPVSYTLLQALLLGELPFDVGVTKALRFSQQQGPWKLTSVLDPAIKKVTQTALTSHSGSHCVIAYQQFRPLRDGALFRKAHVALFLPIFDLSCEGTISVKKVQRKG